MSKPTLLFVGTVLLLGGGYLATLRSGQEWGDDFALYVAHARNFAEGRAYADTGYIYNPHFPTLSPRTYPPIFPLLLSPVYHTVGLDLGIMKGFNVLVFTLFLGVLALVLCRHLSLPYAWGCLVLFALNPLMWQIKDRLMSEMPYLLFAYSALLLMEMADARPQLRWKSVAWGLLAGSFAYLAFGTRPPGMLLIPSLLAYQWWTRRLGLATVAVLGAFVVGVTLERVFVPMDGSALDQLIFDPLRYLRVGVSLVKAQGLFVDNGYSPNVCRLLYLCLLVAALRGFSLRLMKRLTVYEPFVVSNILLLMLWPCAEWQTRYLLPLLPLFFLYAAEGLCSLASLRVSLQRPIAVTLAVAVLVSYAARYSTMDRGPIRQGVSMPEAVALFDYVRSETAANDVFLFQKPRAFALFTGRHASALHKPSTDEELWDYLHHIHADYVVVSRQFADNQRVLQPFIARNADCFEPTFTNAEFAVYRVQDTKHRISSLSRPPR